jgi:hypothetical protein
VASTDFLLLMEWLCKHHLSSSPGLRFSQLLEVNLHQYEDELESILVLFRAQPSGGKEPPLELEIAVRHVEPADRGRNNNLAGQPALKLALSLFLVIQQIYRFFFFCLIEMEFVFCLVFLFFLKQSCRRHFFRNALLFFHRTDILSSSFFSCFPPFLLLVMNPMCRFVIKQIFPSIFLAVEHIPCLILKVVTNEK